MLKTRFFGKTVNTAFAVMTVLFIILTLTTDAHSISSHETEVEIFAQDKVISESKSQ
ncbi:hypothetical protein PPEP_a0514 [Pseudoalteromonas peptidolytica F12-50-A1]|uniref:Uncharacterized protein n=2 Tax=Pseudoalteromonas TaxID=53246 RepID=A0A8I0MTK7_9GAMM|nr:hypothetical protein [Pseudoalteromonas peptidolytica F12-50-A1]GEK09319.1 hypothetical protein PPE03_15680 [Pseudoalteromonas peptidolytica]